MTGRFIVLEGGEGAGKSTQVRHLSDRLMASGTTVVTTREPGGTPFAEQARDRLLSSELAQAGGDSEAVLVSAGRVDHLELIIRPALVAGRWVICDRFTDSTLAYQGVLSGGDLDFIRKLNTHVVGETRPDLVLLIDLPPELAAQRLSERSADRWDDASLAAHRTLRKTFLDLAAQAEQTVVIDGALSQDQVAESIWSAVISHFSEQLDNP